MRYVGLACAWVLSLLLVAVHPAVSAHPSNSPYGQFVGTWYHHGGGMFIYANGSGIDHYRTYVNCTTRVVTNCDEFTKNAIYAGGFTQFRLYRVSGSTATGIVTNSPVSWTVGTKVTITRRNNDTVALRLVVGQPTNGCGPHAPAGYCGA